MDVSAYNVILCSHFAIIVRLGVFFFTIILLADMWAGPNSQTVDIGENTDFLCHGGGSYIYWFIDGVNTENMTSEEIAERGINFSGNYNNYPPHEYKCVSQKSYLTMAGNCLNNNSNIYCVILGDTPPPNGGITTSNVATLTVQG